MIKTIHIVFSVYFGILFLAFAACWYSARNDKDQFLVVLIPATILHGAMLAGAIFLMVRNHAN